jgi:hypothetical protein
MKAIMNIKVGFLTLAVMAAVNSARSQQTTFSRITNGAIVNDVGMFTGAVWGDFNNDGFLDLFVSNWGGRTNVFYRNNGDGTFTKVTQGAPVQDADFHAVAAAADYDNDGYLDLLVPAGVEAPTARHNMLYHNDGNGTFTSASGGGLTTIPGFFAGSAWADYDNDGFVDLFIENQGTSNSSGGKNLLFHNNGDGTFTRITKGAIVNDIGVGYGVLWADYDNDGFMDLLVINLVNNGTNFLYHNNRDGTFTRILTNAVATDQWIEGTSGAAWGDYDNDGLPDLFVTDNNGVRNRLYHNNGNGSFTNVTSGPMLQPPTYKGANGCAWGDYDNDGYLDLFVGSIGGPNGLYHNNGDGTFTQILSEPPVTDGNSGFITLSIAFADYDNDGFLDLFLTRFTLDGFQNEGPSTSSLYHNNGNTNAWLEVKLVGTVANRSAIGAKVRLRATIGGKTFWQLREISNGGGWNSQPLVAHFGMGDATNAETLRIQWPSGTVQEFQNVAAKQILTITEPPRLTASLTNGLPQFSLKGGRGFQYEIDSSPDLSVWSPIDTLTLTNLSGVAQIVDTNPPASDHRFYRAISH